MRVGGLVKDERVFTIFFDGASKGNPGDAGVGAIIYEGKSVYSVLSKYIGTATNNVAEYTALKEALMKIEPVIGNKKQVKLLLRCDSELVAKQLSGSYRIKNLQLKGLALTVHKMVSHYGSWAIQHIPRSENKIADILATSAIENALRGQTLN
jgi:ribonuclease HI